MQAILLQAHDHDTRGSDREATKVRLLVRNPKSAKLMVHLDIIPPSEQRRINERVLKKEDKMIKMIRMPGVH